MLALLLALLAQDRPKLPAPDDDATRLTAPAPCNPNGDEIVVCGTSDMSRFRVDQLDDARWAEKPVRPTVKLPGGGDLTVRAEQRSLPGASAPAAFVTLRVPLGGKKKPEK
ncbi:MAG: hypothetical protein EOP61_01500 [Sphingomonadales bacterium]|nr:MAG: hypothetical protein EOP61_01500 [Sphingomonadales bacterium]